MATKVKKTTANSSASSFKKGAISDKGASIGAVKSSSKNGQMSKSEHAAKGGKALMKAWKRIAERQGEGY